MGGVDVANRSLTIHGQHRHKVQIEKGQVHEIVLRQAFVLEMGVDAAQSLQPLSTGTQPLEAGNDDLLMVADDDEGDPPLTIDQDPDLAAYFERQFTKGFGKLG